MIKTQTLKGFRDFLPKEAKKRQYVIDTLKKVFESYGFEPLETPALEYEEILLGKYGEEGDKLMYRFKDLGGRKVAMRYDQTVPLARVVAQYGNELPMPFKRYQIQPVWRAENTQKGRYREFLQCDADIVGSSSSLSDAEVIALTIRCIEKLGFTKFKVLVNDRSVFKNIPKKAIMVIDKLKKIGSENVLNELIKVGAAKTISDASSIVRTIELMSRTESITQVFSYLKNLDVEGSRYEFTPTLARGLDYYTGMIFEIEIDGYSAGSVCGGGRYDNLIGMFQTMNRNGSWPAVGFAFGFDRLIEAMEELSLFPKSVNESTTKVLVTIFPASPQGGSPELKEKSLALTPVLRSSGVQTEIFLDENTSLEKQLKYADKKGIPYAVIIGPNEAEKTQVTLKNMKTGEQKQMSVQDVILSVAKDLDSSLRSE